MTTVCCKCFKTKTDNGWTKTAIEDAALLSHGYCPTCYMETIKKIYDYRPQQAEHASP